MLIESNNFKLDKDGKITATSGTIGGFTLSSSEFTGNLNGIYKYDDYDLRVVKNIIIGSMEASSELINIFDANSDGNISSADYVRIKNIISGTATNTKNIAGTVIINSKSPKDCISILQNGRVCASLGVSGINTKIVTTENVICGIVEGTSYSGLTINNSGQLTILDYDDKKVNLNKDGLTIYNSNFETIITGSSISSPALYNSKGKVPEIEHGRELIVPSAANTPTRKSYIFF